MPYIGQPPVTGDTTSSFRLLDNIASFTLTFDGSSAEVVSTANDTLTFNQHRFVTAQRVTYTHGGGTAIGGLTSGTAYFIIKVDQNTIKLATSAVNANNNTAINLTSLGVGVSHTLNVAFDGINTKFKATYNSGTKATLSRAGQLLLSINGVIQQPQETSSPTVGFGIDADSTIVFSVAPAVSDVVFGNIIANSIATFDISDNNVDNFTGNGSTLAFTLSKTPANNQNVLVTLDGVVQYPSDTSTTRAYSVTESTLTFVSAPANGVEIQVRHIGFAGATSSAVTGFYGRTGNAVLTSADDINVQNITGVAATFTGNVSIAGTLTYEDVTNVDSVGLITARSGIIVNTGTATTALVVNGNARVTGILTVGSSSVIIDGANDQINVGTAVTISSSGLTVAGVVTATTYRVGTASTLDASGLSVSAGVVTTTTLRVAAGSAAAPSITPTDDTNTGIFFPSADTIAFGEGGSEAARIDSSGRLLVGTSSTSTVCRAVLQGNSSDSTGAPLLYLQRGQAAASISSGAYLGALEFADSSGNIYAEIAGVTDAAGGSGDYPGRLTFSTTADGASSPTERMRIGQLGYLKASNNGSYFGATSTYHERNNNASDWIAIDRNSNATPYGVLFEFDSDPNSTGSPFWRCRGGGNTRAEIRSNGGLANYSANNSNLSDRNAKKDIIPAAGTWDCIKEWEIVNYRYKDQADDADLNLGVIAQQVAESCPEVITIFSEAKEAKPAVLDNDGNEVEPAQEAQPEKLGVKEQQMYWMAIKALQEAQARIEQLEARLTAAGIE